MPHLCQSLSACRIPVLVITAGLLASPRRSAGQLPAQPDRSALARECERLENEAKQLEKQVRTLWREEKFQEAAPLLKQVIELRRQELKAERNLVAAQGAMDKPGGPGAALMFFASMDLTRDDAAAARVQASYGPHRSLSARGLGLWESVEEGTGSLDLEGTHEKTLLNSLEGIEKGRGPFPGKGPMHPDLVPTLNSLATLYLSQGAAKKAESALIRALHIEEKAKGPATPDVARSLINLGEFYQEQGRYRQAEPLFVRALGIADKAPGQQDPDLASSLHSLALLYNDEGAYEKAVPLFNRALVVLEKTLGPRHPAFATCLNNLAELYQAQGAHDKAISLLSRAADIRESQLRFDLALLRETRRKSVVALLQGETERIVSLQANDAPHSAPALALALTAVLRRKGRTIDTLTEAQTALRGHVTPVIRQELDELSRLRTGLSVEVYEGMFAMLRYKAFLNLPPDAAPKERAEATAAMLALASWGGSFTSDMFLIAQLEPVLNAESALVHTPSAPATIAAVQAALPSGTALVEFVRYHRFDARQSQHPWREERYVAYILRSQGPPQSVEIGEAAPIDASIDAAVATMHKEGGTEAAKMALRSLDALVFAPVRAQLGNASHIVLAPDSKLNLVPFDALVDPHGNHALESHQLISYVTTGRDLLRLDARQPARSAAVIVANPDYGPLPSKPMMLSFRPLPGTSKEASVLQSHFAAPALTGSRATVAALEGLIGPAMIHVATHGFYLQDPSAVVAPAQTAPPPVTSQRGMSVQPVTPTAEEPRPGAHVSSPYSECADCAGLAMAGANQGTGIITARAIAGLDWAGTQLVVLSACKTGVANMPSGDGVYGMRRALVLAGAESQVVSLWSVDDDATQQLMQAFYDELARGVGRAEALQRAKLLLLRQPRYAHPYYWSAFILSGDWRPLEKSTIAP